jgi:prolyl-tRNA editing enzyme YbaK/EbsC (Cys-tRNA(Pro) deacylase)
VDSLRWYEPDQVPKGLRAIPHSQRREALPCPVSLVEGRSYTGRVLDSAAMHPAHQRVLEAAARKAVDLEIVVFDGSTHTAEEAATAVGAELGQIVKSLVFVATTDEGLEPVLALVSGANRVDVSRLAANVGVSALRRATAQEANELTGFVIGGIPPFGHGRPMRVVMDPDLGRFPVVWAAGGTPNAVFSVPPATLRSLANATVAPVTEEPERRPAGSQSSEDPGSVQMTGAGTLPGRATSEA